MARPKLKDNKTICVCVSEKIAEQININSALLNLSRSEYVNTLLETALSSMDNNNKLSFLEKQAEMCRNEKERLDKELKAVESRFEKIMSEQRNLASDMANQQMLADELEKNIRERKQKYVDNLVKQICRNEEFIVVKQTAASQSLLLQGRFTADELLAEALLKAKQLMKKT